MVSLVRYATVVSQEDVIGNANWLNIGNLKNGSDGALATTENINPARSLMSKPTVLFFTDFGFALPSGAEVKSVTVSYRHKKGGSCSIGSPTISLLGVDGFSATGVAPSKTTLTTYTKTFTGSKLTRTIVNSNDFGVKIDYPSNSANGTGTISLAYVNLTVEYVLPSYTVDVKKVSGGYNREKFTIEASISNTNLTSYSPDCTLTVPDGFTFDTAQGSGEYTRIDNHTFRWNPKLTNKIGTSSINFIFDVGVVYPVGTESYTGTFNIVEALYGNNKSLNVTITDRPEEHTEEDDDATPVIDDDDINSYRFIRANANDEIFVVNDLFTGKDRVVFAFTLDNDNQIVANSSVNKTMMDGTVDISYDRLLMNPNTFGRTLDVSEGASSLSHYIISFDFPSRERTVFIIYEYITDCFDYEDYADETEVGRIYFDIQPAESQLTQPNYTILTVSEEELDRLGNGKQYIVQSDIQHTTTDPYIRNWFKNNRIGVCNTVSDSATEEEVYAATVWSRATAGLNEYNSVEVEFTYDKSYPVYIVVTGDYPEATSYGYDTGSLQFNEPCIIEKQVYTNRLSTGIYPVPIRALLGNDEVAALSLEPNQSSDSIILYDLPLDENYGTNEDYAIRGVKVTANVEQTDPMVVQAKIHSPNGEIGQRSTVLNNTDNVISIGGLGDLWGFTTLQLTKLEEWEIELSASNILNNSQATINYNDVSITFYLEPIIHQEISVYVEDENIAYYGAFIEAVNIPEGLETDTSFLAVDGTDTNDAYRQNIREKTIEIDFNLSNCDLQTSANMLRQLVKLFTNDKDQYNRPIPKHIRFSHYPNDYFEYIMEEPFDVNTELTDYNVKAKLTIPSGTSYSLEDTVTNTVGNASGLAPLNPIIRIRPSSSNIQIKENNSEQSFQMGYTGNWQDYAVEIDCEDRRAYLIQDEDDKIDISKYVDHNSDWFRLSGEYEFEGVNCTILTVTFNERW